MAYDPWTGGGLATEEYYGDETNLFQKLGYGAMGAVVSGIHGVYNTFASLGNSFGADIEKADTGRWLANNVSQESSRFYEDNQAILDTIGLLGTSFIPGSLAIKAAGAARMGKLISTMKWSTGLENGIAGKYAAQAAEIAKNGSMTANIWAPKAKMIAGAVADNAIDGAVAGTAILATSNQNAAINKDDLGYFQSFGANFNDFVNPLASPFAATMFGGFSAIGAMSAVGRLNKQIHGIDLGRNANLTYSSVDAIASNPGDAYLYLQNQLDSKKALLANADPKSVEFRDLSQTISRIDTEARGHLLSSIKSQDSDLANMVNDVMIGDKATADQGNLLGGLVQIQRVHRSLGPQEVDQFGSPMLSVVNDSNFREYFNERGLSKLGGANAVYSPKGIAETEVSSAFTGPAILLKNIEWFKSRGLNPDEAMLGTYLHELGHHRTLDIANTGIEPSTGKQLFVSNKFSPDVISAMKSDPSYKNSADFKKLVNNSEVLFKEFEGLSRKARPEHWAKYDKLKSVADSGLATESELTMLKNRTDYLYGGDEMMADAFKAMSRMGLDDKGMAKEFPKVYNLYKRNGQLFEQYGVNKVGFDSWAGKVTDSVNDATSTMKYTPQVGDIGNLKLIDKNNTLTWGGNNNTRSIDLNAPWDPRKITPEESDAIFAGQHMRWQDQNYAVQNWNTATDINNLPELQARLAKMKAWTADGTVDKFPNYAELKVKDSVSGSEWTMDSDSIERSLRDSKKSMLSSMYSENLQRPLEERLGPQEFERSLNVDENAAILNNDGNWTTYVDHDPTKPRHAILSYDKRMDITDQNARSMVGIMNRIDQIKTQTRRISTNVLDDICGEGTTLFNLAQQPPATESVTRASKTRGFFNSANADYGTFGSFAQSIGKYVDKVTVKINSLVDKEAADSLYSVVNNKEALNEANVIIASKLRGKDRWVPYDASAPADKALDDVLKLVGAFDGIKEHGKTLVNLDLIKAAGKAIARSKGDPDVLAGSLDSLKANFVDNMNIHLTNPETFDAFNWMQSANERMVGNKARVKAAAGKSINWDTEAIYVPPPAENQFSHVAFVKKTVPEGLGKADEHCLIFGQNEQDLANKINTIKQNFPDSSVLTKDEMIAYKKANGDYDPSSMLSERSFNTQLRRLGVLDSPLPRSDTLELNNFVQYIKNQQVATARDSVSLMFANEISELKRQSQLIDNVSASQVQGLSRIFRARDSGNPYQAAIDTMLNRNNGNKWSLWKSLAETVDSGFSSVASKVDNMFRRATTDEDFQSINKYLTDVGLQPAYTTAAELHDINLQVDRKLLTKTVGKANTILATGQLSLDFLETLVNAVSLPVMMLPELHNLTGAFNNPEFQKQFGVTIPGTDVKLPSMMKAVSNAISDYTGALFGSNKKMEEYMASGLLGREMQFAQQATQATIMPAELFKYADSNKARQVMSDWNDKIAGAVDVAKKFTFAERSEQAVRFISANVAEQIAKAAGITDAGQINAIQNTFINRVHGNYTAAQKPFLFQGVIGQAISLFQTYQFNVMQQAFRNVADGNKKAAAMMVGLQGSIYGMRGLPGFNLLNQQIGAMRGNTGDDMVSSTYNNTNQEMADWLVYGGASNLLGVDLFNRGEINPRYPTIVPTNFADIPAVSMSVKFYQNLANTAKALAASGINSNTLLEGVAHNGLNRPLAGLAASALGYRTTTKGGLLYAQKDEEAWASTTAAITGGKQIDEAIVLDTLYRKVAYDAARVKDLQSLGAKYLGAIRNGSDIDHEQLMQDYVKHGGNQETYNRWFMQISKNASEGQLNQMAQNHNSANMKFYQGIIGSDRSMEFKRTNYFDDPAAQQQQQASPDLMAQMPQG